ncbi:MAG: hypothetical protein MUD12_01000 [Spirochaetes bacterium]|jgi:hypothetical protein|nr:hypothetical protein [Spirochaetota bacterium]
MGTKASYADNSVKISSSRMSFWLVAIFGMLMLGAGIYFFGRLHPYDNLLLGFGMIFTAGGLFFFMSSEYHKIIIDRSQGSISILESSNRAIVPLKIPINYYSLISIQENLSGGPSERLSVSFDISLVNRFGSSLSLANFSNRDRAYDFGKRLQDITGLDLAAESFIKEVKDAGFRGVPIPVENRAGFKKMDNANLTTLIWKSNYSILQYLLMAAILYGFFHIFNFVLLSEIGSSGMNAVLYALFGFICAVFLIIMAFNMLGRFYLLVSPDGLEYYSKIFGRKIGERKMARGDVAFIKNTINMTTEGIAVISRQGVGLINRLLKAAREGDESPMKFFSMADEILSLKDEMLVLNTSSLSISEKLLIEEEILKKMK